MNPQPYQRYYGSYPDKCIDEAFPEEGSNS